MTGAWPDLRLAGPAVACWLAALGGLYLTAGCGVVVAACAALAAGGAAFAAGRAALAVGLPAGGAAHPAGWRRGRRLPGGWLPVGLLLGVVCGAASTAARVATREAEPLAGLARDRATVTVDLVVTDDPHPLRGSAGRPATYAVPAELMGLRHDSGSARLSARVLVLASDRAWRTLLPGQRVTTVGRLGPPRRGDLRAAVLSASHAPLEIGEPPWAQRAAGRLRAGLQRACEPLPAEPGGLLPGLVVGDTSRLEPAVADDFTTTGMTHLVAVSGSNVAIVIGFVLLVTRWARAGPRLAALLCALALVGFVILVRPSPSVLRAAAMGGLGLVALALGRPRAAVPALAASAAVLVMVDPQLAADAGFALSVLATAGLLLIAPGWRDALRERGVPAGLAESLAIPAAAQVACAPVIAAISGTVGLAAIPANLVAVPAVAPATVLGVAAALLSACWPAAAEWVAWLAGWPAWWLVLVARYGADAPAGVAPWPAGVVGGMLLAALLAVVLVAGRRPVVRRLVAVAAVATVVGVLPVRVVASGWPPPGWFVVACDVGQGDAVVLPVGPDQAAVVDAGPDPAATDRCLRGLGVRHVNLLLITHFHADHVGGFAGVFRGRSVAEVVTTGHPEPAAGRDAVLAGAAAEGVPVRAATAGAVYRLGGVQLFVLGPVRPLTGTRSDPNNNSLQRSEGKIIPMGSQLIERAHWGDLEDMHFAGLVRLSYEADTAQESQQAKGYMTGRDIKGRDEQEKDCRGYVEHRKGQYAYTYEEPDTSAYKRRRVTLPDGRTVYRVIRPVFEGALDDLKRGLTPDGQRLDGLIVYDIDRLTRDNRHLEDCIEVVQHFDRPIIDITGTLDLLTDNGRTVARIVVATNNKQSADTARRVHRKHLALQQAGIPAGSKRPFGWMADKRSLNLAEAEVIRAGVRRLIAGTPLNAVLAEWKAQGVVTPTGRTWVRATLIGVLRNPRLCGYRARLVNGISEETGKNFRDWEIVRKPSGEPVVGQWEPILAVDEWETVSAIVGKHANHSYDFNTRKYLLTSVVRCGKPECGRPLKGVKTMASRATYPDDFTYSCRLKKEGGCGGLSIYGPKTDEWVEQAVIARIELEAQRRQAEVAPEAWPREAELIQVRTNIADLTGAWRARPQRISSARYFALVPELEREEQELASEREQWLARRYSAVGKPPGLRTDWPGLTLAEKRAYIKEALVCVLVHPGGRGRPWSEDRLELVWRED